VNSDGFEKGRFIRKSMKTYMKKWIMIWLCIVLAGSVFSIPVNADMGPKPSVRITFENLGNELCYGTLLSSRESTGPSSSWNGKEEDARHNENPNGSYSYQNFGYDVWKAFVDYAKNDDFYFLQEAWQINETKEFAWTYYPPKEFKILLYFPETGEFSVSGVYERYAFDSYFAVNMEGVKLFAEGYGELSSEEQIHAIRSYNYTVEIVSLIIRVVITILIEMAVAMLFGFRRKKQLLLLVVVNIATQVILNVLLNRINYYSGEMAFVFYYIIFEIVVFVLEAILYCFVMKKVSEKEKSIWFYVLYALIANASSFGAGFMVAKMLPGIF